MNATESYQAAARAYADGVRVLFAPAGQQIAERGGRGPVSYDDLESQADTLVSLSADFTARAVDRLAEPTPAERIEVETALLAKALTDLEICTYLLQASEDQDSESSWRTEAVRGVERSAASRGATDYALSLLLRGGAPAPAVTERSLDPENVEEARAKLMMQATDALALISELAADSGRMGLEGLINLGVSEIATAIGVIGLDIARALGKAEGVTKLYKRFRDFLKQAYDAIMALLSPPVAEFVSEQVKAWVERITSGELVDDLLESLFKTATTKAALQPTIAQSQAGLEDFITAIEKVGGLNEAYREQTGLVVKIMPKLKYATLIPAANLPQGKVILAAAYLLMTGYIILVGGDYVDAPDLENRLDRVPGVRRQVEAALA